MPRHYVEYTTGKVETVDKIPEVFNHLMKSGIIRKVIDTEENTFRFFSDKENKIKVFKIAEIVSADD